MVYHSMDTMGPLLPDGVFTNNACSSITSSGIPHSIYVLYATLCPQF